MKLIPLMLASALAEAGELRVRVTDKSGKLVWGGSRSACPKTKCINPPVRLLIARLQSLRLAALVHGKFRGGRRRKTGFVSRTVHDCRRSLA